MYAFNAVRIFTYLFLNSPISLAFLDKVRFHEQRASIIGLIGSVTVSLDRIGRNRLDAIFPASSWCSCAAGDPAASIVIPTDQSICTIFIVVAFGDSIEVVCLENKV